MSSRNIAVRKDVYDALSRDRRVGESFTEVIARLLAQRGPLDELLGSWAARGPANEPTRWRELRGIGRTPR